MDFNSWVICQSVKKLNGLLAFDPNIRLTRLHSDNRLNRSRRLKDPIHRLKRMVYPLELHIFRNPGWEKEYYDILDHDKKTQPSK